MVSALSGPPLRMLFYLDYEDDEGVRFVNSPGLLPLVGVTRRAGFEVEFVTSETALLELVEDTGIDVVGISSMERLLKKSIRAASRVRAVRPDVILMIGGNAIDPFAADLAAHLFDVVVLGEAEHVLPALLTGIARARGRLPAAATGPDVCGARTKVGAASPGGALTEADVKELLQTSFEREAPGEDRLQIAIGNLFVRDAPRCVVWKLEEPDPCALHEIAAGGVARLHAKEFLASAPMQHELDDLCVMPWDVIEREQWRHFEFYTQRGCRWGRCKFCSVADRTIRALSPRKVVETIAGAVEHGVTLVSFADDLFVQYPQWNEELLDRLVEANFPVEFRAQTMATRAVWPLLERMRSIGFSELAFGVETLSPSRAEFMAKSTNGEKYVANAKETVVRTAEAGICPVLYMIMIDPTSTLLDLATELRDVIAFSLECYAKADVLPKASYSLIMLPVACTATTAEHPHDTDAITLGPMVLHLPTEFKVAPEIVRFATSIGEATRQLPRRRENIAAYEAYLRALIEAAAKSRPDRSSEIREVVGQASALLERLITLLDQRIDAAAAAMVRPRPGANAPGIFDYRRLGGYVAGVERLGKALERELAMMESGR
ncbi:MAG: cobalamin-dependent protein [Vitreimonas sp.]